MAYCDSLRPAGIANRYLRNPETATIPNEFLFHKDKRLKKLKKFFPSKHEIGLLKKGQSVAVMRQSGKIEIHKIKGCVAGNFLTRAEPKHEEAYILERQVLFIFRVGRANPEPFQAAAIEQGIIHLAWKKPLCQCRKCLIERTKRRAENSTK